MNERIGNNKIYLLAKEAGLIEFEQFPWNPALGSPTYESVEKARKFAELIVRECVEVCAGIAAVRAAYNDADGRDTAYSCGDMIKEHFGVEE